MERLRRGDPAPVPAIGSFRVTGVLGEGARGSVLEALDAAGAPVALKVLHGVVDARSATRFEREARVLAALDHPNIVKLAGVGVASGRAWMAMERVQGVSLDELLAGGALAPDKARDVARQIALALAHAHARGVVHRDLKPANVLVEAATGRVVIVDFGVARVLEEARLTRTGEWLGTPLFMAPEQLGGATGAGAAADVWGLGAVLYQMLTGRPPFDGSGGLLELATRIASTRVVPPSAVRGGIPAGLEAVCLGCLQLDPGARPDAAQVARALAAGEAAKGRRRRRRRSRVAWLALGASAAAGLALLALRPVGGPVEVAPTPLPAASAEGLVWQLGVGPPARQDAPVLWDLDEDGRLRVEPLRGLRTGDAAALRAVFLGEATRKGDGRVRVRYDDLAAAAGVVVWERPGNAIEVQDTLPAIERVDGEWVVVAPDDSGEVAFPIGRARWRGAAIEVEVVARPAPRLVDTAQVKLTIAPWAGVAKAGPFLSLEGRQRTFRVRSPDGKVDGVGEDLQAWTRLRLAPGERSGERVLIGERSLEDADALLVAPARDGTVLLGLAEHRVGVRGLQVSGRPLSVDVPALAWTPVSLPRRARLIAGFELVDGSAGRGSEPASEAGRTKVDDAGDELGGPCLALGDERAGRYLLEVAGDGLVLWSGGRLLARCALPGRQARGALRLERDVDRLRGALTTAQGEWWVEAWDPLPLGGADHRGGFGSSGPAVRFTSVLAYADEEDADRAATDAGRVDEPAGDSPAARWRAAALALARVSHPAWIDRDLVGARGLPRRREVAAAAAAELLAAAPALPAGASDDARARATLGWVLAGQPDRARSAASDLVAAVGPAEAVAAIDRLLMVFDEPGLISLLANGWFLAAREGELRTAAAQVVLALPVTAGLRALALETLAAHTPDAEEVVALLREALPDSPVPDDTRRRLASALLSARRADEASAVLDEVVDPGWYGWRLRMDAALQRGRADEALEAAIAVAALRQRPESMAMLESLLEAVQARASPAHVALVLAVLAEVAPARADDLRAQALAAAERALESAPPRGRDLASYARALATGFRVEEVAAVGGGDERPTQVLLRARFSGDLGQVTEAGKADPLVFHLALLDRAFSGRRPR